MRVSTRILLGPEIPERLSYFKSQLNLALSLILLLSFTRLQCRKDFFQKNAQLRV